MGHTQPQRSAHSVRLSVTHSSNAPNIHSASRSQTAPPLCTFCPSLGHTKPHRFANSVRLSVTQNPNDPPHSVSPSVTQSPNAPHILFVSRSHTAPTLRTFFPSLGHTQTQFSAQSLSLSVKHSRNAPPNSVGLSVTHSPTAPHILSVSRSHTIPTRRTFSPSLG